MLRSGFEGAKEADALVGGWDHYVMTKILRYRLRLAL